MSGHVLAELLQSKHGALGWYRGELLNLALDCANRLLPAFNSTTGLPYPRVNLRTGLRGLDSLQVTCTACAGSMILEFAALSRLTGESVFEEKAGRAMDVLWAARHRQSNLVMLPPKYFNTYEGLTSGGKCSQRQHWRLDQARLRGRGRD